MTRNLNKRLKLQKLRLDKSVLDNQQNLITSASPRQRQSSWNNQNNWVISKLSILTTTAKTIISLNTPSNSRSTKSENLRNEDQWLQLNQTTSSVQKQNLFLLSKSIRKSSLLIFKSSRTKSKLFKIIWKTFQFINSKQKHSFHKETKLKVNRTTISQSYQNKSNSKRQNETKVLTRLTLTKEMFNQQ